MKRSEHLEPLSHDHYEGLLVAGRIKKGLANEAPLRVMADYVAAFWRSHLFRHFDQEEEHLLPLIKETPRADLGKLMVAEHREIRAVVDAVDEAPSASALERLARLMKEHIRFEERELFPMLEADADPAALESAGARLHAGHVEADLGWNPAFWD